MGRLNRSPEKRGSPAAPKFGVARSGSDSYDTLFARPPWPAPAGMRPRRQKPLDYSIMPPTRSNKRPSSRAVAAKIRTAHALTETLEGRWMLSGGASGFAGVPASVLPYLHVGPLTGLSTHGNPNGATRAATGSPAAAPKRPARTPAARPT